MQINFPLCMRWLLQHEGGFSNHPEDPGGATMLGVTKATYEDYIGRSVTIDELKALTQEDVEPTYRTRYWNACPTFGRGWLRRNDETMNQSISLAHR